MKWNKKKINEEYDVIKDINVDEMTSDLIGNEEGLDDYQLYLNERKAMLPGTKEEREKIEVIVKLQILDIFKEAKIMASGDDDNLGYFKYRPFREISYIKDFFPIISVSSDRNQGKSYSSHEEITRVAAMKRRFMMIRNIDDEVKAQIDSDSDQDGWLTDLGWTNGASAKMPNIIDLHKQVVGYYRALNTSSKFKSVDFPKVDLIVYEEFNEVGISDKYMKFVKFVSSIIRFNPDGWAILQANYVNQQDEMLQALGVGGKQLDVKDFVIFNWEVGAILVFVPKGIYRKPKDQKKDLAYRTSLGKFDVWKSQFGGGFSNEEPINIVSENSFTSIKPVFNIYHQNVSSRTASGKEYGAFKMTLYKVYDDEGRMQNVLTTTKGSNNKPIFIYDYLNKIKYPHAHLMDIASLDNLIEEWNTGNLKTTEMKTHEAITAMFAVAKRALQADDEYISEIENIVS